MLFRSTDNAVELATWLCKQKGLDDVLYPGLNSHPQHELAVKQQRSPSGDVIFGHMISIDIGSIDARDRFLERLEVFTLAESLGGVESLVCVPYNMTHAAIPEDVKLEMGITETLIRLSIGIEDIVDLKADLQNALGN